jgi:hypothetical protein
VAGIDRLPWEKQKGESKPAFDAFARYRDMPNRSLRQLARELNKSLDTIGGWSRNWGWAQRVEAWDMDQDRILRETHTRELVDMTDRHVSQALMLQNAVIQRLQSLFDPAGEPTEALLRLSPASLSRMLEVGVTIERTARGLAGERIAVEHSGEVPHRDAELARRIADDPESRWLATELLARVAGEEPLDPSAFGMVGDEGEVAPGEAPPAGVVEDHRGSP